MRAKLEGVLQVLRWGQAALDGGQGTMRSTRREVVADWRATAEALRRKGEEDLAARVDRFVARMPDVQTDAQRMADRWREQVGNRTLEPRDIEPPGPKAR